MATSWLRDLSNRLDFAVRRRVRFGRAVDARCVLPADLAWQEDARVFLGLLNWSALLAPLPNHIELADVGARTFALAPVVDALCQQQGRQASIVGIELDAYRRFTDLRTRRDHGEFWASRIPNGRYFAGDVRSFHEALDVVLLLDPFVSSTPLLAWGLPLTSLAPQEIFAHCYSLLRKPGVLLISNPSEDEARISDTFLRALGMRQTQRKKWASGVHRRLLRAFVT